MVSRGETLRTGVAFSYSSFIRERIRQVASHAFPTKTLVVDDAAAQVEQMQRDGYGIQVIHNHRMYSDGPREMLALTNAFPEMATEKFVAPVTEKFYRTLYYGGVVFLARQANIDLYDLMTNSSSHIKRDVHGRQIKPKKLFRRYLIGSAEAMAEGGIAILAPQGTRKERLSDSDDIRAVEALSRYSDKAGAKVAILPTAIQSEDPDAPYDKGPNMGKLFTVTFAPPILLVEARKMAGRQGISLDKLGFRLIAPYLPDQMLGEELRGLPQGGVIYER